MTVARHDLIVIGGGPGGYVAAIRASQLGLDVVCVESRDTLGGTCLNVGCIPSKALLHNSHLYESAAELASRGVRTGKIHLDLPVMMADKTDAVGALTSGIDQLFKKHGVSRMNGLARLAGPGRVEVEGREPLEASNVIIATGSEPATLADVEADGNLIVDSTGALSFENVPDRLIVVGAGYIGLELGSVWQRLGSQVTVVEYLDRIAPGMDSEIARRFQKALEGQGLIFRLGARITGARLRRNKVDLSVVAAEEGANEETLSAHRVLVATGRRPFTQGLGLEEAGVRTNERGFIEVDENFTTSVPGVYAIGDVIPGPMLAHKASSEGHALAERLAGGVGLINYGAIPAVVYTEPEVASVGVTEDDLKAQGIAYRKGRFSFTANARGRTTHQTEGMVKVLSDEHTDRLLGVHVIGTSAGELIAEATLAMEFGATSEDLALTCHAHPTMSESIREAAAVAAYGKTVHS